MFCGSSACVWGLWSGICLAGGLIVAGVVGVFLGLYLHRRTKKVDRTSTVHQ
jgi:hypothetical protein